MPDVDALADDLLARLPPGTPERAANEQRYLRSTITHLGVTMPDIRATVRAVARSNPDLDTPTLRLLVGRLWSREIYELRQAAVLLLDRRVPDLDAGVLDLLEDLLRSSHTWALVDPLAIGVAGRIATADARVWTATDRWVGDPDLWIRRAALLAHLPSLRTDRSQFDHFTGHADQLLDEREFFIRKAIGWVLREVARRDAAAVVTWLEPRTSRVSVVTLREAVKYVPADDRERLLAAYRGRGRAAR